MSETSKAVIPGPFNELAMRVGMEFDDCSMAAAETYRAVREQFSPQTEEATLYQIDDDPTGAKKARIVHLSTDLRANGDPTELVLIWPATEKVIKQGRGFLRKAVTLTQTVYDGDPMLGAKIGEDNVMPLATFTHREGSFECSYVQLGSEMSDETVVMTGLDAGTPRHDVVEAIRIAIERPWAKLDNLFYTKYHSEEDKKRVTEEAEVALQQAQGPLQNLLDQQMAKYSEQVVTASEAQLVRRCAERVAAVTRTRKLNVLTESDNSTYTQDMHVANLLNNVRSNDGRIVSLALAKEAGGDPDEVHLMAITRGDIALPVASMFNSAGTVVFENEKWNELGAYRKVLVNTLLSRVRGEPLVPDWQTPRRYSLRKNRTSGIFPQWDPTPEKPNEYGDNGYNYYDRLTATYCHEIGLLKKDEGALNTRYQKCGITREGAESTYRELERFFSDPEIMKPPWGVGDSSPPLKLALSRLPQFQQAQQRVFNLFGAVAGLNEKLGDCSPEEERLIRKLHAMSQQATRFSAVLEDLNTGKTEADIAVIADLAKQGTSYDIRIFAKPQAMSNAEFKLLLQNNFDTRQPLFTRNGSTPQQIDSRARQMFDILRQLEPAHA
jgi:hypothetical protein